MSMSIPKIIYLVKIKIPGRGYWQPSGYWYRRLVDAIAHCAEDSSHGIYSRGWVLRILRFDTRRIESYRGPWLELVGDASEDKTYGDGGWNESREELIKEFDDCYAPTPDFPENEIPKVARLRLRSCGKKVFECVFRSRCEFCGATQPKRKTKPS